MSSRIIIGVHACINGLQPSDVVKHSKLLETPFPYPFPFTKASVAASMPFPPLESRGLVGQ